MYFSVRHWLVGLLSMVVLCCLPLAYGQQSPDCKRDCERDYWRGVSECHRSHTLYTEIRQCQDDKEKDRRKCTTRCSQMRGSGPDNCGKRCDGDYWDDVSACYQSSYRYNDIRKCESSAQEAKENCRRYCSRRANEEAAPR